MLNDILNQMNIYYNNCILEINQELGNITELNKTNLCSRKELKSTIKVLDILRKNNTLDKFEKEIKLSDFNDIDKKLEK